MKQNFIILIAFLMIGIMLSSCTLWYKYVVTDKYKQKKALIQSILDNPDDFDSIIKNSRFYDQRFFVLPSKFTSEGPIDLTIDEIIEKIKDIHNYEYEFAVEEYYFSEHHIDNFKNSYEDVLEHAVGVLKIDEEDGEYFDTGLIINFIRIDNKWYIYNIFFVKPPIGTI
jgi:hypothetical protein